MKPCKMLILVSSSFPWPNHIASLRQKKFSNFLQTFKSLSVSPGQCWGRSRAYPRNTGCEVETHPGRDTRLSQGTHTVTPRAIFLSQSTYWHVFGRWMETREPGRKLHTHGENMHRNSSSKWNQGRWTCEACVPLTTLTLAQHCFINIISLFKTGTNYGLPNIWATPLLFHTE